MEASIEMSYYFLRRFLSLWFLICFILEVFWIGTCERLGAGSVRRSERSSTNRCTMYSKGFCNFEASLIDSKKQRSVLRPSREV